LEQTGSKSVLWTAVGATSGMHETLLHVAAILNGQHTGKVLLVDADLARRALSTAVDYGQQPGLADLLSSGGLRTRCLPTGFERLSILPAGLLRQVDLPTIAAQLEELLEQLADEFSVVLICGASTSDPASATLARIADATYFVVQLGAVEASEAQAALRDFRAAGARVLGCIAT
jgi:Mrp family chromosome partitioning ATPase